MVKISLELQLKKIMSLDEEVTFFFLLSFFFFLSICINFLKIIYSSILRVTLVKREPQLIPQPQITPSRKVRTLELATQKMPQEMRKSQNRWVQLQESSSYFFIRTKLCLKVSELVDCHLLFFIFFVLNTVGLHYFTLQPNDNDDNMLNDCDDVMLHCILVSLPS